VIDLRDDWQDKGAWDQFVERHPEALFCHYFSYATLLGCYGYVARNLCFLKDGELIGVLPAAQVNTLLTGRRLVSQPFSEYGGILLEPQLSEDDVAEVFRRLSVYRQTTLRSTLIEMHGNHGVPHDLRDKWTVSALPQHVALLSLNRSEDELWHKVVRYSARKAVNQARNNGLTVEFECNSDVIRKHFMPLYRRSMRRLGVPPHKPEYYLGCYQVFGDKMLIAWAKHASADAPIAGLLGFLCGNRVSIINTISDQEYWHLRPNDLLHWSLIQWARDRNCDVFDFGTVRYDGQKTFKQKWGAELTKHNHYFIGEARALNSSSETMQVMAEVWRRYVPGPVAQRIGPILRRQLTR